MSAAQTAPDEVTGRPHLIYFADPMCSWCWGFAPVIQALTQTFGDALPIRVIMGGLRPGTTDPMPERVRAEIRAHWEHVAEASGQPFDWGFFDREQFVYDTEPASRAVVVLRRHGLGLSALHRLQQAFYAQNRDVTRTYVLADTAEELGLDAKIFRAEFEDEAARTETLRDYAISQRTGVTGFPTLIAGAGWDNQYVMVTQGFQPVGRILPALGRWLETIGAPPPTH